MTTHNMQVPTLNVVKSFVTSSLLTYCTETGWLSLLRSLCYCREVVPSVYSCQQSVFNCM